MWQKTDTAQTSRFILFAGEIVIRQRPPAIYRDAGEATTHLLVPHGVARRTDHNPQITANHSTVARSSLERPPTLPPSILPAAFRQTSPRTSSPTTRAARGDRVSQART